MPQWQTIVLIIVSFSSLIIALYCLFFMVPVKRFWERVRSLGGGMKGIESHVDGVRDEIRGRLSNLEMAAERQLAESREATQGALDKLARDNRETRRELERLRADMQSLQAELRGAATDTMKVGQSCEGLTKQVDQLLSDFDALDVELRESVRQLVADSLSTLESTVLSALEAMQQEIVYVANGAPEPDRESPRPRREGPRTPSAFTPAPRPTHDNIITMEPLFARLRDERSQGDADDARAGSEQGEGDADEEPGEQDE